MGYFQRLYFEDCLVTAMWTGGVALALQLLGAVGGWTPPGAARAVSVALVAGLFTGLIYMGLMPPLPVKERWQWVPWLSLASLLLLFAEEGKAAPVLRLPLLVLLAGALEWLILRPSIPLAESSETTRTIVMVAVGVAIFVLFWSGESRAAHMPAWRTFTSYAITAAGTGLTYSETISTGYGQFTGGLAASLAAAAVVGLGKSDAPAGRTPVTVATTAFGTMLLLSSLSPDFPKVPALLLLAAWLVPLVPHPGSMKTNSLQLTAVVLITALGAFIAKA
jgi:hypothetical protein